MRRCSLEAVPIPRDGIAQLSAERAPTLITLGAPITNTHGMGGSFPNDTVGDVLD
jgi:hypothetical protein